MPLGEMGREERESLSYMGRGREWKEEVFLLRSRIKNASHMLMYVSQTRGFLLPPSSARHPSQCPCMAGEPFLGRRLPAPTTAASSWKEEGRKRDPPYFSEKNFTVDEAGRQEMAFFFLLLLLLLLLNKEPLSFLHPRKKTLSLFLWEKGRKKIMQSEGKARCAPRTPWCNLFCYLSEEQKG